MSAPLLPSGPSTLWRISEFDLLHGRSRHSSVAGLESSSIISSSLLGALDALEQRRQGVHVVEVLAACRRLQEAALIHLRLGELVWPLTVFPQHGLYHSRHDLAHALDGAGTDIEVLAVEPAALLPPGLGTRETGQGHAHFRPLGPALWLLALHSPEQELLTEIGGRAAYRALRSAAADGLPASGAVGHAAERLHREAAALRHIAGWPGMSRARGIRLLNALYLNSNLLVSRSHPLARPEPAPGLGRLRP